MLPFVMFLPTFWNGLRFGSVPMELLNAFWVGGSLAFGIELCYHCFPISYSLLYRHIGPVYNPKIKTNLRLLAFFATSSDRDFHVTHLKTKPIQIGSPIDTDKCI